MSSILRDKSPAIPSTACPWSLHCSGPHTQGATLSPTVPEARAHTLECREHIAAAAIITHTITVRSERLPREREVKWQD